MGESVLVEVRARKQPGSERGLRGSAFKLLLILIAFRSKAATCCRRLPLTLLPPLLSLLTRVLLTAFPMCCANPAGPAPARHQHPSGEHGDAQIGSGACFRNAACPGNSRLLPAYRCC